VAFQTIWAIGTSMVILGLMIRLPYYTILCTGAIIVAGHNIFDFIEATHQGPFGFWWDLLHRGNFAVHHIFGNHSVLIIYAFVSWSGLMMLGYCFGKIYRAGIDEKRRKKSLLLLGAGIILFFTLLRATNLYGNPYHWFAQGNWLFTFLSFINVHKYPPSLLYMCITIGPALLFLAVFEKTKNRFAEIISVYGRVPFLYYLLHFFILHLLSTISFLVKGHTVAEGMKGFAGIKFILPGDGYHLPVVYLVWITVVVMLYPVCKWFSNYKNRKNYWWLSYL
jgi:uncharacterized membrane protein